MKNIKTLEKELYLSLYGLPKVGNANENYLLSNFSSLDISKLFDYSYEYLVELYQNKIIADKIYAEITFCKEMDELLTEKNNLILNKIKN